MVSHRHVIISTSSGRFFSPHRKLLKDKAKDFDFYFVFENKHLFIFNNNTKCMPCEWYDQRKEPVELGMPLHGAYDRQDLFFFYCYRFICALYTQL